ncbi:hypothetical protein SAZU_4917 [Streptomyces azureus]|uniref:Uncharacterized protein n=1 Tax=Streptomyces azureus TaxID=146537 RepID=A0A0K8PRI7_STRAJ|nr:hypothetical protein SAZU_4917 [Streptomyces azureus]
MASKNRRLGQRGTGHPMDAARTSTHDGFNVLPKKPHGDCARNRAEFLRKRRRYPRIYRVHDELVDHLTRSTPLSRGEALRVIQDVLAYFDETTEEYVRRRHRELQAQGLVNAAIFERIEADLKYRAVAPPELSLRQLRRIVYG